MAAGAAGPVADRRGPGPRPRRCGVPGAVDAGRRAGGRGARAAHRGGRAGLDHRRPAGLGAAAGRRARRGGRRRAADAAARRPAGSPTTGARGEVERVWGAAAADHAGPGRGRHRGRGGRRRAVRAAWSAASTSTTCPTRGARAEALGPGRLRGQPGDPAVLGHRARPTWCCRSRRWSRRPGTYVDWEGRRAPVRGDPARRTGALPDGRVLHALADEMDVDLGAAVGGGDPGRAGPGRHHPAGPAGRPAGAGRRRRRPPAAAGRCWPPGGSCSTAARCRTASRTWPARPRRRSRCCRRRPRPGSGVVDGAKVTVRTGARRGHAAGPAGADAGRRGLAAGQLARLDGAARRSGSAPARVVEISGGAGMMPGPADPTLADFGTDPFWLVLLKVVAVFVLPRGDDAVLDRVRAQGRRPHAEPDRPQPDRPVRLRCRPSRTA